MTFKSVIRELRGTKSRPGIDWILCRRRSRSHVAPYEVPVESEPTYQSRWATLPSELLLDILKRVEESEVVWPARASVVSCASVCRSWRSITKEIVKPPEQSGRLTFPSSLKQPGSRDMTIHCFIRRDEATSTYFLYYGFVPSEGERDKLLLAARRRRRATGTDFIISLTPDDVRRGSSLCIGRLRANFLGTKFTIYDNHPVKPTLPKSCFCGYVTGTVRYELNVLHTRGPRRMKCTMYPVPISPIKEGRTSPAATAFSNALNSLISLSKQKEEPGLDTMPTLLPESPLSFLGGEEPLILRNKAPRWHEQLQCWCLNFRGRVTVASVKNFQLVASGDPSNMAELDQEKVLLQFGKIGKDIFTMDYLYPLSAFQAFAICLSSFNTKLVCE